MEAPSRRRQTALVTEIVAHRCNSPEAVGAAVDAGARWIEIDAAPGPGGELVASHDPGGRGSPLPQLLETAVRSGLRVTVDLKCPAALVPDVCDAVSAAGLAGQALISGNYGRPWPDIRALLPGALLGWSPPEPGAWERLSRGGSLQRELAASAPEMLLEKGLEVLLVHHSLASRPLAGALHACGLQLHAWTVNRRGPARRLARMGIDAIVTDRPGDVAAGVAAG